MVKRVIGMLLDHTFDVLPALILLALVAVPPAHELIISI
jgi:hypothetical protein